VEKVRLLNGELAARELSQRLRMLGGDGESAQAVEEVNGQRAWGLSVAGIPFRGRHRSGNTGARCPASGEENSHRIPLGVRARNDVHKSACAVPIHQ